MSIDHAARLQLHRRLDAVLGPAEASTLMSHLPPLANQVATKGDLEILEERLRAEISISAAGLRTEMADLRTDLRTEMADLRTEMRTEMADLRTEMRTEMADLRTEMATLGGTIANSITRQTKWMFAVALAWGSVLIAAARILP